MTRIGVVGSGFMAETHVDAYDRIDDATVTAIASPNTAAAFVERTGLEATTHGSVEALLDDADVDVVDICSPTPTHHPIVETAAERGVDVFCEKPIAGSLEDAQAIADAADNADISLMIGHVLRFFPQYERINRVVDDGGVGDPGVARARRLSPFPDWGSKNWYADRDCSGGVLVDLAIHDLDFLRWVLGDVNRVYARRSVWEDGEHGHVTMRFENGAVGYVEASWGLPSSQELTHSFELAGDDGLLEFDGEGAAVVKMSEGGTETASPVVADGYQRQLEAFLESVRTGTEPPVTAEDAIETLRLAIAANRSATENRPVALEEVVV
ncbi:Gfo/Idh/MocA family protein [Natronorubrum halophilum]|uniref:Gfo/Idh/MocA family protein n=1 Tax=Natronorubrum halophilum TaxID=1702106 RepID=UPI0010C17B3A|nr:Gfo/Idh/MocA family oxidoreductase [Natronorubrum halophilum]